MKKLVLALMICALMVVPAWGQQSATDTLDVNITQLAAISFNIVEASVSFNFLETATGFETTAYSFDISAGSSGTCRIYASLNGDTDFNTLVFTSKNTDATTGMYSADDVAISATGAVTTSSTELTDTSGITMPATLVDVDQDLRLQVSSFQSTYGAGAQSVTGTIEFLANLI